LSFFDTELSTFFIHPRPLGVNQILLGPYRGHRLTLRRTVA
jgi:hypothetical protein